MTSRYFDNPAYSGELSISDYYLVELLCDVDDVPLSSVLSRSDVVFVVSACSGFGSSLILLASLDPPPNKSIGGSSNAFLELMVCLWTVSNSLNSLLKTISGWPMLFRFGTYGV